jgi:phospholipase C
VSVDIQKLRQNIDTIFIVMLENRSFDHVLGARDGTVPLLTNTSGMGPGTFDPKVHADAWTNTDLPHGRDDVQTQLEAGMRGFVQAYENLIQAPSPVDSPPMRMCQPSDIPVTTFLADNYCVCTRWHASLPTDTQPNRLMAMSGTTLIDNTHLSITNLLPSQFTILEWLADKSNVADRPSFAIYVDHGFIPLLGFPSNFLLMPRLWPLLTTGANDLSSLAGDMAQWNPTSSDVTKRPPAVVYCEPYYNDLATLPVIGGGHGNCNHAPLPMAFGEAFLKKVYDAVTTANPRVWARSMLVVVYDEHGGFFDHVPPPPMHFAPPAGSTWSKPTTAFETLGVRVPAIVVSPFSQAGSTCTSLFDHTSLLQLVTDRFGGPDALANFGDAGPRKQNGVRSVVEALADTPRTGAPPASPAAPTPPLPPGAGGVAPVVATDNSQVWAKVVATKAASG